MSNRHSFSTMLAALFIMAGCAPSPHADWDAIDYSSVYRKAGQMENDTRYSPPHNVTGCVDEDLYNCK